MSNLLNGMPASVCVLFPSSKSLLKAFQKKVEAAGKIKHVKEVVNTVVACFVALCRHQNRSRWRS